MHSEHALLPWFRRKIYGAIDTYAGSHSHRVKTWCGILTTQKVLSLLNTSLGADEHIVAGWWNPYPKKMVKTSEALIQNKARRKHAVELYNQYYEMSVMTGELMDSPYYREWCIFEAGLRTLGVAIDPEEWQEMDTEVDTTDFELKYYSDTAKWACIAYVGATWHPTDPNKWFFDEKRDLWIPKDDEAFFDDNRGTWDYSDSKVKMKRKQFWEWWLKGAISEAWGRAL